MTSPGPARTDPDADARRRLADVIPEADFEAAWAAYEASRIAGLCHEGAWEVALGAAPAARTAERPIANPKSQIANQSEIAVPVPDTLEFFIDPGRCIGCQACVQACTECDTHKGQSMIQLDYVDRAHSTQTVPVVCMHCDSPTCAEVCPADAIKRTEDGVVQTARKPRCIACNNCVLACPFGIPKMNTEMHLMMKCDMCYDRTSVGLKPMCASVCPSQALAFGTREEMARLRPNAKPVNTFQFGAQTIRTKVNMMVPLDDATDWVDVTAAMHEPTIGHEVLDDVFDDVFIDLLNDDEA